jgi:NCS1 family nucleobase:cation symporter-1
MAGYKSCSDGLYLVRRTRLDRWRGKAVSNRSVHADTKQCVTLMIASIWPSFYNVHNGIPTSGTSTLAFVSFLIFWLCSLPAIWFPVHKIRHLFTFKSFVVPICGISFFIWAIVRAKGLGPIVKQKNTAHGSALAWGMVKGIMSAIANFATLIVNAPDFARFAREPKDAFLPQLFAIPICFALTSFIGIIVSSSSTIIFGQAIWNPLELLTSFLHEGGSKNRAGVFFISTGFALAQLGTNIAANSVSAVSFDVPSEYSLHVCTVLNKVWTLIHLFQGTDLTALLPRYINIRRGGYICASVGLAMCPWK